MTILYQGDLSNGQRYKKVKETKGLVTGSAF